MSQNLLPRKCCCGQDCWIQALCCLDTIPGCDNQDCEDPSGIWVRCSAVPEEVITFRYLKPDEAGSKCYVIYQGLEQSAVVPPGDVALDAIPSEQYDYCEDCCVDTPPCDYWFVANRCDCSDYEQSTECDNFANCSCLNPDGAEGCPHIQCQSVLDAIAAGYSSIVFSFGGCCFRWDDQCPAVTELNGPEVSIPVPPPYDCCEYIPGNPLACPEEDDQACCPPPPSPPCDFDTCENACAAQYSGTLQTMDYDDASFDCTQNTGCQNVPVASPIPLERASGCVWRTPDWPLIWNSGSCWAARVEITCDTIDGGPVWRAIVLFSLLQLDDINVPGVCSTVNFCGQMVLDMEKTGGSCPTGQYVVVQPQAGECWGDVSGITLTVG